MRELIDVALLQLEPGRYHAVPVGTSESLRIGDNGLEFSPLWSWGS